MSLKPVSENTSIMKTIHILILILVSSFSWAQLPSTLSEHLNEKGIQIPYGMDGNNEQLLDSIVCFGLPDGGTELTLASKTLFTYNEVGDVDTFTTLGYSVATGELQSHSFSAIAFSNDSIFTASFNYDFDLNEFLPVNLVIDKLNASEKPIITTVLVWDNDQALFKIDRQLLWEYNSNGVITNFQVQIWDEMLEDWINNFQQINSLNSADLILETVNQGWDAESMQWLNFNRVVNSIRADTQVIESVIQTWEGDQWQNSRLDSFFYTDEGTRIFNDDYLFDFNLNDWSLISREYFLYQEGFPAGGFIQVYQDSMFVNSSRFTIDIDVVAGNPYSVANQYEVWQNDSWLATSACDFFWSTVPLVSTSIPNQQTIELQMANPYPLGSPIFLNGTEQEKAYTISLYSLEGKLEFKERIRPGSTFQITESVPTGIYFVSISNGAYLNFTKKVIIENKR